MSPTAPRSPASSTSSSSASSTTSASSDATEAARARQRAVWAAGDFARIGENMQLVAELICDSADVRPGERVLDVACGAGNVALAAARRYAEVVGVDLVFELVARARAGLDLPRPHAEQKVAAE